MSIWRNNETGELAGGGPHPAPWERVDQVVMFNETVQLKSGGPDLTVDQLDEEGERIQCSWLDLNNWRTTQWFAPATLRVVNVGLRDLTPGKWE